MKPGIACGMVACAMGVLGACSSGGGAATHDGDAGIGGSSESTKDGSTSPSNEAGSVAPGGSGTPGVSLTANTTALTPILSGYSPAAGTLFATINLTLKNTGANGVLSTNPVLFSLTTSQAIVVTASFARPNNVCSSTQSVASGGQITCAVAFEIPTAQTPATLSYNDQLGDKVTVAVPPVPPVADACAKVTAWEKLTSSDCDECVRAATDGTLCGPAFKNMESSCLRDAGFMDPCNLQTDPCACFADAGMTTCATQYTSAETCVASLCQSLCP